MKRTAVFLFLLSSLLLGGCSSQVRLFNGKNLDGWKPYLKEKNIPPSSVWSVRDGVLRCEGSPNGYLRTVKTYSNYKLHVEWRWPENPTNSGVLLHATGEDRIWPTSIEAQLRSGDAGDLILIGEEVSLFVDGTRMQPDSGRFKMIPKKNPSSENKPGQWNTYDIVCNGGIVELTVNGILQNRGTGANLKSGSICLQSEGSPIEFRNILLKSLP